jgi:hypothetical protein
MKYEVVRHTFCGDREIEDLDYFDNKRDAEKCARELTENYADDDGHPWSGDKFFVVEVSEETIRSRQNSWAMSMAFAEMGGEY